MRGALSYGAARRQHGQTNPVGGPAAPGIDRFKRVFPRLRSRDVRAARGGCSAARPRDSMTGTRI